MKRIFGNKRRAFGLRRSIYVKEYAGTTGFLVITSWLSYLKAEAERAFVWDLIA